MVKLIKTGKKNGIAEIELVPSDPEINIIKIEPKKKRELQTPQRRRQTYGRPKGGWTPGVK